VFPMRYDLNIYINTRYSLQMVKIHSVSLPSPSTLLYLCSQRHVAFYRLTGVHGAVILVAWVTRVNSECIG
jgi:hypothetical protein